REAARHEQIAVGGKRLVCLLQIEEHRKVLLLAPVIEIAKEAARIRGLAGGPEIGLGQAVKQSKSSDGNETLALALFIGGGDIDGLSRKILSDLRGLGFEIRQIGKPLIEALPAMHPASSKFCRRHPLFSPKLLFSIPASCPGEFLSARKRSCRACQRLVAE